MSCSADVDWKRVPGWFWLIVIFQCRMPVFMGMRVIMHDNALQPVTGEGLMALLISLPACLMVLLFTLQVTRATLCQGVLMLMMVAPLADIVLWWLELMNDGLPETLWPVMFVVVLDSSTVMILAASRRLRQVFWRPEEYED
ncbi:hypothetical protein [Citrobacter meridianamericanus]|uniref:Uncharacterized protein n=1 Tax=Citrobacter meridianamericanus TaxID=2894201 RepID=A0ABT1BHU6_9ENTR|nr:hypothetical protein [Citrobacter meridianamericanus]MCO5784624.1 hypothetical protein [Citrobacter meridianamericanus]